MLPQKGYALLRSFPVAEDIDLGGALNGVGFTGPLPAERIDGDGPVRDVERGPVEHDRRDYFIDPEAGLEISGQAAPAGRHPNRQPDRNEDVQHHRQLQVVAGGGGGQRPHDVLALGADIEQAGAQGEGHRQAGDDQRRRVDDHVGYILGPGENPFDYDPVGLQRIEPGQQHDEAAEQKAEGNRHQGNRQRTLEKFLLQRDAVAAHAGAPAIIRPILFSSASAASSTPMILPSKITAMRSETLMISSSSKEISSTALPLSRCSIRAW